MSIREELITFTERAGYGAFTTLQKETGVKVATLSRLASGTQKDIMSASADALRAAIARLSTTPTEAAPHE